MNRTKSLLLEGPSISGVLSWNLVTETEKNHRNLRKASQNRGPDMNSGLFELEAVQPLDCGVQWPLMISDRSKVYILMLPIQTIITKNTKNICFALGNILTVHVSLCPINQTYRVTQAWTRKLKMEEMLCKVLYINWIHIVIS